MRRIVGLLLIIGISVSCGEEITGPTVTTADVELFNEFLNSTNAGQDFEWGGNVFNRSKFVTEVAIKLELINPDSVVFFTTSEHLIEVDPQSQVAFKVIESGTQIPTPSIPSIAGWSMTRRLVSFREKAGVQ